jgi:sugar transferase (PEP-CTERM/EpsH1 system associated)
MLGRPESPASDERPALLFLTQRLPFPPNKGEKIRYHHVLRHLSSRWRVYLGCFVDEAEDWGHTEAVRALVSDLRAVGLDPRKAKRRCTRGVLTGRPFSVEYFASAGLQSWVDHVLEHERPQVALIGSSSMGQYLLNARGPRPPRMVTDFVDVDSEKWRAYAQATRGPMKLVYARERRALLAWDRKLGAASAAGVFVTQAEVDLFARIAPELAPKLHAVENGVDAATFAPENSGTSPYGHDDPVFTFTGHMDYRPNVDAVVHFTNEVLPRIRRSVPTARFCVVGANPVAEVTALGKLPGVHVTGRVPDVRPWVGHATVCVAPLLIARGLQNKVLEAMACARPVVASPQAREGIDCEPGRDLLVAEGPDAFAAACLSLLENPARAHALGLAARALVLSRYSWGARLSRLDHLLDPSSP